MIGSAVSFRGLRVIAAASGVALALGVVGFLGGASAAPGAATSTEWQEGAPAADASPRSSRIQRFPAPECSGSQSVMSPDGRYIFTDNFTSDRKKDHICVIDVRSKRLVTRIRLVTKDVLAVGEFTLSRDGRHLYVDVGIPDRVLGPSFVEGRLIKVDTRTFRVVATFTPEEEVASGFVDGMSLFGLTGTSTGSVLAAQQLGDRSTIYRADVDVRSLDAVTASAPADTSVLVLSKDESIIWALGKTLAKIDAGSGATLARSNQVGGPWPRFLRGDVALSPDERTLYINDTKRRELIAVDSGTLKVRQRVRIAREVWGIAMNPSNGHLWAITSEILPRVPVTLPPDLPAEIWKFDARLRNNRRIVMPSPGAAEALSFAPTGAKAYVSFRYYPRPSEVLILRGVNNQ